MVLVSEEVNFMGQGFRGYAADRADEVLEGRRASCMRAVEQAFEVPRPELGIPCRRLVVEADIIGQRAEQHLGDLVFALRYHQLIVTAAARYVGDILKYVPDGQAIAPRYSFYM
jgi:hypothetical protein